MTPSTRVLIVDDSAESREVLRTLLERNGAQAIEASRPEQATHLSEFGRPDLILLDLDSDHSPGGAAARDLGDVASRTDTPILLIGAAKQQNRWPGARDFMTKPYHYGPLIRRIEALLARRRAA